MPELERDRPGLKRRLHAAATGAARLNGELEARAAELVNRGPRLAELRDAGPGVRGEVYRRLHAALAGIRPGLESDHVQAIERLLHEGRSGDELDLPRGVRARLGYESLEVFSTGAEGADEVALLTRPCPGCADARAAHFDAGARLELGHRTAGLRMRPLPGGRTRKLQDILVDAKVPRHLRDTLPLVFADGELAWIPGIAIDAVKGSPTSSPGLHAELGNAQNRLLESRHQLKESAS